VTPLAKKDVAGCKSLDASTFGLHLIIAVSLGFIPGLVSGQEPNPQKPDNPQQQNPQPDKTTQEEPPVPTVGPAAIWPTPLDAQIHPAGQAVPWLGSSFPLRWGDFSIANFSYNYVNDRFQPLGAGPSEDINLNILRTSLVFEHHFGKQDLLLQYNPQLAVLNGKVAGNADMDNEVALGSPSRSLRYSASGSYWKYRTDGRGVGRIISPGGAVDRGGRAAHHRHDSGKRGDLARGAAASTGSGVALDVLGTPVGLRDVSWAESRRRASAGAHAGGQEVELDSYARLQDGGSARGAKALFRD